MNTQLEKHEDRIQSLEKGMTDILVMLKPINETFTTISRMGKWITAIVVFVSICVGIIIGLKTLLSK